MEPATKAKVTEQGVLIPKHYFEGVEEVEIRQASTGILVLPVAGDDPIFELGTHPVGVTEDDLDDVSEHHGRYLYGS